MCNVLEVQVCQDCALVVPAAAVSVPRDMQMLISEHAAWQGLCTVHMSRQVPKIFNVRRGISGVPDACDLF